MILRQFRAEGISAFREYLAACRANPELECPRGLLDNDSLTDLVMPHIEVDDRKFVIRSEAAAYFADMLAPLPESFVMGSVGLWTWLSLFYFDSICPIQNGRRSIKSDYFYIYEPKNNRYFYRHLLSVAWRIQHVSSTSNRLLLCTPVSTLDQVTADVMQRLFLIRIPCIFEVLDFLYWDEKRGRARTGIVDPRITKPGDLRHRLPIRIRQLEKTYDLNSLKAEQLIELLGEEFKQGQIRTRSNRS